MSSRVEHMEAIAGIVQDVSRRLFQKPELSLGPENGMTRRVIQENGLVPWENGQPVEVQMEIPGLVSHGWCIKELSMEGKKRGYEFARAPDSKQWREDKGLRVFIIPFGSYRGASEQFSNDAKGLYRWLKQHDLGGRRLALGGGPVAVPASGTLELIVKRVDQGETHNRLEIPDVCRWHISDEGVQPVITEQLIKWDGRQLLHADLLTKDSELFITESLERFRKDWVSEKDRQERMKAMGLHDPDIPAIRPGANRVILYGLRKDAGKEGPQEAQLNFSIKRENDELFLILRRPDDLFSQLARSNNSEWVSQVLQTLGLDNIEQMADRSLGVDGVMAGDTEYTYKGEGFIKVPLREGQLLLIGDIKGDRRRIMQLLVTKGDNGEMRLGWEKGMEALVVAEVTSKDGTQTTKIFTTPYKAKLIQAQEVAKREARQEQREAVRTEKAKQELQKNTPEANRFFISGEGGEGDGRTIKS